MQDDQDQYKKVRKKVIEKKTSEGLIKYQTTKLYPKFSFTSAHVIVYAERSLSDNHKTQRHQIELIIILKPFMY